MGSAALAAVAVLGFGYGAAREFDTPYLANLAIDASSSVLSPGSLSQVMEWLGELGKATTFGGVLALQFVVYLGVWSLGPRATPGAAIADGFRAALGRLGICAVLFLALAGSLAAAADTPPLTGWEWGEFALLTVVEVALFVGLAFALERALGPLLATTYRPWARGAANDVAVPRGSSRVVQRRQFLRLAWVMGAGTMSVAAAWYLGQSVAATARTGVVRLLDSMWSEEVTPTEDFYVVSKNIEGFDPELSLDRWTLKVIGLVDQELALSLEELQGMPISTDFNTLMCITTGWEGS